MCVRVSRSRVSASGTSYQETTQPHWGWDEVTVRNNGAGGTGEAEQPREANRQPRSGTRHTVIKPCH